MMLNWLVLLSLIPFSGCIKEAADNLSTSETKWGHLDDWLPTSLYNMTPGQTLIICVEAGKRNAPDQKLIASAKQDAKIVEAAVRDWFRAIDRVEKINFKLALRIDGKCEGSVEADAIVNVFRATNNERKKTCKDLGDVIGYAKPLDSAKVGGDIVRCNIDSTGAAGQRVNKLLAHTLHEMGHLFGMCDSYEIDDDGKLANAVGMHKRCSKAYQSVGANRSIMNAGYAEVAQLTIDDALGALEFAKRLKSSDRWPKAGLHPLFQKQFLQLEKSGKLDSYRRKK